MTSITIYGPIRSRTLNSIFIDRHISRKAKIVMMIRFKRISKRT